MKQAEAIWALVNMDEPATAKEVSEFLDSQPGQASGVLLSLFRDGYLTRETRERDGYGENPYEYEIREI